MTRLRTIPRLCRARPSAAGRFSRSASFYASAFVPSPLPGAPRAAFARGALECGGLPPLLRSQPLHRQRSGASAFVSPSPPCAARARCILQTPLECGSLAPAFTVSTTPPVIPSAARNPSSNFHFPFSIFCFCHPDRRDPAFSCAPGFGVPGLGARFLRPACCTGVEGSWLGVTLAQSDQTFSARAFRVPTCAANQKFTCHPERVFCAKDLNRPRQQPICTAPPVKNLLSSCCTPSRPGVN